MPHKTAILLINVGTPASPETKDVREFLKQFLGDKHVIQLPYLFRKLLVNGIIAPFRAPKSKKIYKKLWTEDGSPLLIHTKNLAQKLQLKLENDTKVFFGMRYGNPSIHDAISAIQQHDFETIIIVPLFPQYAFATTETAIDSALHSIKKMGIKAKTQVIKQFYNNPHYIHAFTNKIKNYLQEKYDFILFSYHGLPLKQVYKSHEGKNCTQFNCLNEVNKKNTYCYQASCYHTTRLLAKQLQLNDNEYTTCFQSRFAKNWLSPFTDEVIVEKAKKGHKKILVISPSFVADCLETIVEIGDEYATLFANHGGEKLQLVESLNADEDWAQALANIIQE